MMMEKYSVRVWQNKVAEEVELTNPTEQRPS
jgi:hypothetical protein